jgi:cobalt/nickel transport system permease protein
MHVPDGFLSTPVWAGLDVVAAGSVAAALRRAKGSLAEKQVSTLGVASAFTFAAQMVNFPVGAGTSGHYVGGAMLAILLGPSVALLAVFVVLLVQALLFADGGILALGANLVNMGIVAPLVGLAAFRLVGPHSVRRATAGAFLAGLLGAEASALAAGAELAVSGTAPAVPVLLAMGGVHLVIGAGEGLVTAAAVRFLCRARPDLIPGLRGARA